MGGASSKTKGLSEFQRKKLVHEFQTFYDINGDGVLTYEDFDKAREFATKINKWKEKSEKYHNSVEMFEDLWKKLSLLADENGDGKISVSEWLQMWESEYLQLQNNGKKDMNYIDYLPFWLHRYLTHRFYLLDKSSDGTIDAEEFEQVLVKYGVTSEDAKKAFDILTEENKQPLTFRYFCELAAEYYFSNDPDAKGNFISGRLEFDSVEPPPVPKRKKSGPKRESSIDRLNVIEVCPK